MLGLDRLELDTDLLTGDDVQTEVDISERTTSDLLANPVLSRDSQIHGGHPAGGRLVEGHVE